jgi:hypothetical protein
LLTPELLSEPPTSDNAREQRRAKRVEKPANGDESMNPNKERGLQNNWQCDGAPQTNSKKNAPEKSGRKDCDIETDDEGEEASNSDRGNDMEETGKSVAAISFRSPGLGRFFLEAMENAAHPKEAREDGKHAGDEARSKGGAKRVHGCEINMSILG